MVATEERTKPQVLVLLGDEVGNTKMLGQNISASTYKTYRKMRKHPTIAFARWLVTAPVISSAWAFEANDSAPEGAKEFIDTTLQSLRLHLLRTVLNGWVDFGWQGFEVVYQVDTNGKVKPRKLKALLQDNTTILVEPSTGAYAGLLNEFDDDAIVLESQDTLCFSFEPEGNDLYGSSMLENIRAQYDQWETISEAANRFDEKIAGTHLLIYFPPGFTEVDGEDKDNAEIAREIMTSWQSTGQVCVPTAISPSASDPGGSWKIELLSDTSGQGGKFIERMSYIDKLFVRGLGLPERAALEGEYGTKADASEHADFAIMNMELRHQEVAQTVNWHLVDRLLEWNYGEQYKGTVYLVPAPISDQQRAWLRKLYMQLLGSPDAAVLESESVDIEALRDAAGVPSKKLDDAAPATLPVVDDTSPPDVTQTDPAAGGIQAQTTLNGIQVTSAMEVLSKVQAGALAEEAGIALLVGLGLPDTEVRVMVAAQKRVAGTGTVAGQLSQSQTTAVVAVLAAVAAKQVAPPAAIELLVVNGVERTTAVTMVSAQAAV